jgi:DNA/RNA-binding domain of Phe-tRNA-synthetase-like protein
MISLSPELKVIYPKAMFGSLIARDVPNRRGHELLEERKRDLESRIRESYADVDDDGMIQSYRPYYRRWGKTYPIEFQIKTIKGGGNLPQVSVLVDSMFMAEVKNRILTSGHDLEALEGDLTFDVSDGGERYLKLNGKEQALKKGDVILIDEEGILASVLYGPARRTSIASETRNALYFGWCPYGIDEELIKSHTEDILNNIRLVYEKTDSTIQIHL